MGHGGAWTDTGPAFERGRACIPALSPGSRVALSLTSPCLPFLLYRGMMMTAPASWVSCEGSMNRRPKCTWHAEALGRSQLKMRPRFLKFTAAKRRPGFSACPSSDALHRSSLFRSQRLHPSASEAQTVTRDTTFDKRPGAPARCSPQHERVTPDGVSALQTSPRHKSHLHRQTGSSARSRTFFFLPFLCLSFPNRNKIAPTAEAEAVAPILMNRYPG